MSLLTFEIRLGFDLEALILRDATDEGIACQPIALMVRSLPCPHPPVAMQVEKILTPKGTSSFL